MAVAVPVREPHCAGEYPLSSMAELQAQVTAAVSQVTRCSCSGTNLTLNSSSNRRACVFQILPCLSQTAFCCGGCCQRRFAPQIFELLSKLAFKFSSLVVNQPSRYAEKCDPVFEKVVPHDLRMLAGNHGNNTKNACEVKNVNEAQLVAFIICQNKQVNGCCVTKLSICAKSCRQLGFPGCC